MAGAAYSGNLDLCIWLHENGCPLINPITTPVRHRQSAIDKLNAMKPPKAAAKGGHIHILQWLMKNKVNWEWSYHDILNEAIRVGQLKVVDWLITNTPEDKLFGDDQYENTRRRNKTNFFREALRSNTIHVVQRAWEIIDGDNIPNGPSLLNRQNHANLTEIPSHPSNFEKIKFCHSKGGILDKNAMIMIAMMKKESLKGLKWAIQNGGIWDKEITETAARIKNWPFLQLAIEKGCPWDKYQVLNRVVRKKNPELHDWLVSRLPKDESPS
jgi:hypothetical protein